MALARELTCTAIGLLAGALAVTFGILTWSDIWNYGALEGVQRSRVWFGVAIFLIAGSLSILAFVFRLHREPLSQSARYAIGSLVFVLVFGGIIFYRSMPP